MSEFNTNRFEAEAPDENDMFTDREELNKLLCGTDAHVDTPGRLGWYKTDAPDLSVAVVLPQIGTTELETATARWTDRLKNVHERFDTRRVDVRFMAPDTPNTVEWHVPGEWFDELEADDVTKDELLDRVARTVEIVDGGRPE